MSSKAPRLEKYIVKDIMGALKKRPCSFVYKTHGSGYQRWGIPDILYWEKGVSFAFEVKRPGKTSTQRQKFTQDEMRKAGVIVAQVTSVDEVLLLLDEVFDGGLTATENAHSSTTHQESVSDTLC